MIGGVSASVALKAGAGLLAGVVAGGLGFCFLPRLEPSVLASRPAVEKPIFVATAGGAIPKPVPTAPPVVAAALAVSPAAVVPAAVEAKVPATPAAAVAAAVGNKGQLDRLAAALKSSRGVTAVSATPVSPPSEEASRFCAQGLVALASGDIASARLFLKRAADSGDSRALMALGDSYDAPTLSRLGVVGMRGDPDRAHDFYARALAAGVNAAKERIAAVEAHAN